MTLLPLHPSDPHDVVGMTLLGRLGEGGMGVVHLARHGDGDLVALKVIRPDLTADPQFRSRFTQEVRHALRVRGPFLAEAREASTSLTPQFIAWVYVPGDDLGLTVHRHGPLAPDEVTALAAALADSLGRLHSAGVVHRDVKPSNIQVGPRGPVLLDLGVSKSSEAASLTTVAMSIGTPSWMSPEQWRGADHGPAGDIWGWGAVVAFAAGGSHPFGSGTGDALGYRILHETPALPVLAKPSRASSQRHWTPNPGTAPAGARSSTPSIPTRRRCPTSWRAGGAASGDWRSRRWRATALRPLRWQRPLRPRSPHHAPDSSRPGVSPRRGPLALGARLSRLGWQPCSSS